MREGGSTRKKVKRQKLVDKKNGNSKGTKLKFNCESSRGTKRRRKRWMYDSRGSNE